MVASARRVALAGLVRQGRGRLLLEIDVGELLAVVVTDNKARFLFFDRPRRREAEGGFGRSR
jgi:hypothetical protein